LLAPYTVGCLFMVQNLLWSLR